MNRILMAVASLLLLAGCGSSPESARRETPKLAPKEILFADGQRLYLQENLDSARTVLLEAVALDANYRDALEILAPLHFDLAARSESGKKKMELLRQSRDFYIKLEALGAKDPIVYERLCEIAGTLHDTKTFVKYAKKNADAYPYDRQLYNLSVAYFTAEEYNNVINVCKQGIDKFKNSPFAGTFYRQLGRAYMKMDRDQTAERTFYTGLGIIDRKMAELRKNDPDYAHSADFIRLKEDKAGILTSLKYIHTTYKAAEKLADVEKKLKELGK